MTPQDNEPFADLVMNPLYLAFDKKPDAELTATYFTALQRFEFAAVRRAVDQAILRLKFFPKVAELIELIEGDPEVRGYEAWERVLQTIRRVSYASRVDFRDPAIHAAVQAMGGWRAFWFLDRLPADELGFKAHEFRKLAASWPGTQDFNSSAYNPMCQGESCMRWITRCRAWPVRPSRRSR
jgi:Domain of unknown function (DUF6475)